MKLTLHFLFRDLSQYFGMYLVVFSLNFFNHGHGCLEVTYSVICVVKSKVMQLQKLEIFKT